MQDGKVYSAAFFGFSIPGMNLFINNLEPVLKALVLLGQTGVAAVTILYIYSKWKKSQRDTSKPEDEEND